MNTIEEVLHKLRQAGTDVWIAGPQTESSIIALENAIGIRMPPSYRHFLATYGGIGIDDSFVSGIIDNDPVGDGTGWLITDTTRFRNDYEMPDFLLAIQADEDAPYCIDTRERDADGEFAVVCYELNSRNIGLVATNFGVWILQWLQLRSE